MWVFLAVLAVFFSAAIIALVAVRIDLGDSSLWAGAGVPTLPKSLMASTAALGLASLALERARRSIDHGSDPRPALRSGLALGIVFVLLQGWAWIDLWQRNLKPTTDLYGWSFYVLTGVHALHVLGGLAAIGWVLGRWHRPAAMQQRRGAIAFTAMYWHFLGIAWIAFYALLWWAAP
ncbi:MAG: cytochrome c oxidase subunit 3 [Gemmatimonadaceae bacterium]